VSSPLISRSLLADPAQRGTLLAAVGQQHGHSHSDSHSSSNSSSSRQQVFKEPRAQAAGSTLFTLLAAGGAQRGFGTRSPT
jgi:hypothetical protein